jgi:protein SCO1
LTEPVGASSVSPAMTTKASVLDGGPDTPPNPPGREGGLRAQVLAAIGAAVQARVARLVGSPWFWAIAIGFVFVMPLVRGVGTRPPQPPPMKLALPAFTLTDQRGQAYGSADLKGRIWVADFVFTSCPTVCPKLTQRMQVVAHRARNLGQAFHLVTFTVDPENDTPERLAAYAREYHADASRWTFLTGPLGDVETTVVKGFKVAMGKEPSEPGSSLFSIFHGEKLVLVDADGNIRGYYDADDAGIDELLRNTEILVNVR